MKKIDVYKNEIERIKSAKGKLTAKILVEEAENKNSPLHDYFEWDDKKEAYEWRLHRARGLINIIKYDLKTSKNTKEVYAYEIIKTNGDAEYKHINEILSNRLWKKQIVEQAIREISYWREKYEIYSEFSPLIKEIKKIERRFKLNDREKNRTDSNKTSRKNRNKSKN